MKRVPAPLTQDQYSKNVAYVSLTTHPEISGVKPLPIHVCLRPAAIRAATGRRAPRWPRVLAGRGDRLLRPHALRRHPAPADRASLTTHSLLLPWPQWGAKDPVKRGPVVASSQGTTSRNAIGAFGGSYCIYRALSVASGALDPVRAFRPARGACRAHPVLTQRRITQDYSPDYGLTHPAADIGPHPGWFDEDRIVTMDPFGHVAQDVCGLVCPSSPCDLPLTPASRCSRK